MNKKWEEKLEIRLSELYVCSKSFGELYARGDFERANFYKECAGKWNKDIKSFISTLLKEQKEKLEDKYSEIFENVAEVYCHITNGQLSKPEYKARVVTATADDILTEEINKALKEQREEIMGEIEGVKLGYRSWPPGEEKSQDYIDGFFACRDDITKIIDRL